VWARGNLHARARGCEGEGGRPEERVIRSLCGPHHQHGAPTAPVWLCRAACTAMSAQPLALLKDLHTGEERTELYRAKLALCSVVYDFRDDSCQPEKDIKRQTLLELIEFVNKKRSVTVDTYPETMKMIKTNLFRSLAPTRAYFRGVDDGEEEPEMQPAWPHLQLIYEFFLRFIVSSDVDPKVAKRHIGKPEIVQVGSALAAPLTVYAWVLVTPLSELLSDFVCV
jgi:hypothetical protein